MTFVSWTACSCVAATLIVCMVGVAGAAEPSAREPALFREPHRPQFHYTPQKNWMNDPNGLVYLDGEYHLFHQYNPEGNEWGHMSWAHAVSRDLVHWEHLPVALREENGVMIFSGSAVVDHENTSGFGTGGKPPMVAIYTGHGHGKQTQDIAYSRDRGRTWTKYSANPVIDEKLKDFRDPKVFWHEPSGRWVMVVSVSDQRKVRFYGSKDLKSWAQLGEFGGAGVTEGIWECPDLFELPVARADGTDSGRKRWVLVVSVGAGTPAGGGGVQYFVGDFDGKTFTNDNPKETKLFADHGPDFFAAQSFSDLPAEQDRRVWIGWMSNWRYAAAEPTTPWRTAQSLPRELMLVETPQGVRLAQKPVRELEKLRAERLAPPQFADAGQQLELHVAFPGNATVALKVHEDARAGASGGAGAATVIGYDPGERRMYVDRTNSRGGEAFHKEFPARFAAPCSPDPDGTVRLQILIDTASVEVFGDGGLSVITANTFAPPTARGWSISSAKDGDGGDAPVSVRAWKLKSIWNK